MRAQKADGAIFQAFCESRSEPYLPADPKTIRAFIEDQVKAGKKPATVKRYVATIARVHIAAGLLNPCSSEAVRLGVKKMGRETSARQDQAHPLGWKKIKEFIDGAGESLRADRERAMLCVAHETLARRGELVAGVHAVLKVDGGTRLCIRVSAISADWTAAGERSGDLALLLDNPMQSVGRHRSPVEEPLRLAATLGPQHCDLVSVLYALGNRCHIQCMRQVDHSPHNRIGARIGQDVPNQLVVDLDFIDGQFAKVRQS